MNWEETIKKESKSYTKRKLRRLLEILESDMDDFSKLNQAKGFVQGMLKGFDETKKTTSLIDRARQANREDPRMGSR